MEESGYWFSKEKEDCPLCGGNGEILDIFYEVCKKCFGTGMKTSNGFSSFCLKCRGAGYFK